MKYSLFLLCMIGAGLLSSLKAQVPPTPAEQQVSFIKEDKPHAYYIEQSQRWWEVLQKDMTNENAWYNYYRANRNAQGTANWRTDYVNEAPNLMLGADIVKKMEAHIPGTFTYHFIAGSTGGADPSAGAHLVKAYEMKPDYGPLLPNMVTYATSTGNSALRKEVNHRWFQQGGLSAGLLSFGYNLLQSVAPDAIVFTQYDNDTYPLWMLQDVKGLRPNVQVINIDFLLYRPFRERVFRELGIPAFHLDTIDINEYEANWQNVLTHVLATYSGSRPLYISHTVDSRWYEGYQDRLVTVGLALEYRGHREEAVKKTISLVNEVFLWDVVDQGFEQDIHLHEMNLSYLPELYKTYRYHTTRKEMPQANRSRQLAYTIINTLPEHPKAIHFNKLFAE